MPRLDELLDTPDGAAWLAAHGVYVDCDAFAAALEPPRVDPTADALPVCMAQQIYADYHWSVLAKVRALHALPADRIARSLLWSDVDRCGSDALSAAIGWPREPGSNAADTGRGRAAGKGINLVPTRRRDAETRFVTLDDEQIDGALNRLRAYAIEAARAEGVTKREVLARYAELESLVRDAAHGGLRGVNHALTRRLFAHWFGNELPDAFVSELFAAGHLDAPIARMLNRLPDVIAAFNAGIDALARDGIDVPVPPRDPDWLPLFLSCEHDARRVKLVCEMRGGDTHALGRCKCGAVYDLVLGGATLGIAGLPEHDRLSPDVTLPIHVNDRFSGIVAGRSSGLYGLVLNRVMREALDMTPIPMLLPRAIVSPEPPFDDFDGLVHAYLMHKI